MNFRQEKRSNQTHQSVTDRDCRLARKSQGTAARLSHLGSVLMDNRHGLIVATDVRPPAYPAEREAAVERLTTVEPRARLRTLGADKGHDAPDFVAGARAGHTTSQVSPTIHQRRPTSAIEMLRARSLTLAVSLLTVACHRGERAAGDSTAAAGPRQGSAEMAPAGTSIILGTTTSTDDSGLLDSLLPRFRAATGINVKVIAVGTGAALDMARRGNADAVLVHAPAQEREYIASGDLVGGRLIMHNDFLLVGPPDDPAAATARKDLAAAMRAIARAGPFVSRGDGSGTEQMELVLWKESGIDLSSVRRRESTGQGMGATLNVADQHRGYTLTDRATFLALKGRLSLVPVFEGDPKLLNIYHAYVVNPAKHPGVKAKEAERFIAFLVQPATQQAIGEFGRSRFGQSLFIPDAGKDSAQLIRRLLAR